MELFKPVVGSRMSEYDPATVEDVREWAEENGCELICLDDPVIQYTLADAIRFIKETVATNAAIVPKGQ